MYDTIVTYYDELLYFISEVNTNLEATSHTKKTHMYGTYHTTFSMFLILNLCLTLDSRGRLCLPNVRLIL